jgi:hypothetical protein
MKSKTPLKPTYGKDLEGNPITAYQIGNSTFNTRKILRKDRINKDGLTKVIIEVRIHFYGGTGQYQDTYRFIATKVFVHPKNWNKKDECVNSKEPNADIINKDIDKAHIAVKAFINSKGRQTADQVYYEGLSLESLREFFPSRPENRKTLYDYIEDYITLRKGQKTPYGTLKEFKSLQNRLAAFDKYRHKETRFEDISLSWSDDFEFYLRNEAMDKKGYNAGTVHKSYTILVTVLNHYYNRRKDQNINLSDDFRIHTSVGSSNGFKRGKQSVNPANPLFDDQLEIFKNFVFEDKHLQVTKNRFLWQCYCGVRFVDAFTITKNQVIKGWLRFKPSKTERYSVEVNQPLNEVAIGLLQKYNYDMTALKITNQVYNRQIKDMFKIINKKMKEDKIEVTFREDYGSHSGRDTFITMCINSNVDWKTILGWVGQSSFKIIARYYGLNDKYQEEKMKKISTN